MKDTSEDLGLKGEGVEELRIPAIDKKVCAYEEAKKRRCKESPKEVAAKVELLDALKKHREKLLKRQDGTLFYRRDGRDYDLVETLKAHDAEDGSGEE